MIQLTLVFMGLEIPKETVDACFEPNVKILVAIIKFFHRKNCQEQKPKYDTHQMTTLQYLT